MESQQCRSVRDYAQNMLGNSNIYFDKENRIGQQARQKLGGGAAKHRKGLGHAGESATVDMFA